MNESPKISNHDEIEEKEKELKKIRYGLISGYKNKMFQQKLIFFTV